jgi:YidC/Oxa1 family membrane protein insertase
MFDFLYRALGSMLSFFDTVTGTYVLALLFYALIFKIVFLPFSIKQQKNQIKLAKLTPKIELIRAKYKGRTDQPTMQKQQQEIMELQQKEGYSPLSGCLPLLIQLPIIILLYAVIQNPLSYIAHSTNAINTYNDNYDNDAFNMTEFLDDNSNLKSYYQDIIDKKEKIEREDILTAIKSDTVFGEFDENSTEILIIDAFIEKINGAQTPEKKQEYINLVENYGIEFDSIPNFELFGINLAKTPSFKDKDNLILVIIPILAAVSSWASMWFTKKMNKTGLQSAQDMQAQASMKIMDLVMPLMTLFFAFNFSGMLGIYWVFQSVLGIGQSFILAKAMPLPKYSEEELKEMQRQRREVEKAQRQAAKQQPKHKSLHYIDEDDYDQLPTVKGSEEKKRSSGLSGSNVPEIKD